MERRVIHLNIADFAVAVERVVDSRLKSRAVIIAPGSGARAFVYDMSDEAYREGVRKGMPVSLAKRFSRNAVILPPKPELYERAAQAFVKKALPFSPFVEEGEGDGHLFLDVTRVRRLFGSPQDVAMKIRKAAIDDIRLNPIWSVASNKLISKAATRIVKPAGEYIVEAGEESRFLKELPLRIIPGISGIDAKRLRDVNLRRAGEVSQLTLRQLSALVGGRAEFIYHAVRGIDNAPVLQTGRKPPSEKADRILGSDSNSASVIESAIFYCSEQIGDGLRRQGVQTGRIELLIDYSDGVRASRFLLLHKPASSNMEIFKSASAILSRIWSRRVRIRHIRIVADKLSPEVRQLELFSSGLEEAHRCAKLDRAIDSICFRFGKGRIKFGRAFAADAVG